MIEKSEFYMDSTNGQNQLHVVVWYPMSSVRAILQISHGMSEYVDRYDRLATELARKGILVVGNDHLGHGQTAKNMDELGYFPTKEKSKTVVDDLYSVTKEIREQYPSVPFILMGHSMGSFMARRYMMTYGDALSGAIIMGTGSQPGISVVAGKVLAGAIRLVKGDRHRSKLLFQIAFSGYNKKIHPLHTTYDWLSRDRDNVEAYMDDDYCGFPFTVNGYGVLFDVLSYIQNPEHIKNLPKSVPTLFVSGKADPVGNYGADVRQIADTYRASGMTDVAVKLYANDRHEILNELDYEQVHADIWHFLEKLLGR